MAKRIEDLPATTLGRPPRYPWNEWMDGSAWEIVRGEDFEVASHAMQKLIMNRAYSRGRLVSTRLVDENTVQFQFRGKREAS